MNPTNARIIICGLILVVAGGIVVATVLTIRGLPVPTVIEGSITAALAALCMAWKAPTST